MIRFENVNKIFYLKNQPFKALQNVNLEIREGEIFGVIGFSGAGKSTLVRCINYLEEPSSGDVYFKNQKLGELNNKQLIEYRHRVGMIFQQFNLLAQKNVFRNVCYPLEISRIKKKEARSKAHDLLKLVGLEDKAESYPAQLSGGQKQRVAIARALASNPEVLLCDEATSALDPLTTNSILQLLKDINRKLGVTIVVITHEMKVVEQICDRVAVINKGLIEEVGEVNQLFINPKSEIAKKLILPNSENVTNEPNKPYIRIAFDGESSSEPIMAGLILRCQSELSVLGANTVDIGGKAYGQMYIEMPSSNELRQVIADYLKNRKIRYSFEEVEE